MDYCNSTSRRSLAVGKRSQMCFISCIFLLIFFSLGALFSYGSPLESSTPLTGKPLANYSQKLEATLKKIQINDEGAVTLIMGGPTTRRLLRGGLGSSPPRCASKCGRCTPCRPVHVPVPPGTPVTTEYYPEAWRCKCGNKLYMP